MGLKDKWYNTLRWTDFGWWLNVRDSDDSIDDKQWTVGVNVVSEGNKLCTLSWYTDFLTPESWATKGQAIAVYSNLVLTIHNKNLFVYNTTTKLTYTKSNAVWSATDVYQILTQKSFWTKVTIVLINTNNATTENVMAYEFDWTTFTTVNEAAGAAPKWVWIADRNFKCGAFHQGKLLLWGHPSFPSSLYSSRTGSVTFPNYNYDFSAYDSSAQNVGDGEAIVSIIINHNELFIFKTNSVHRNFWNTDTWTSYAYQFKQESATWALNQFCAIPVEQDVIYFDGLNIRRLSYEQNIQALNDDSVSKDISPIFASLPSDQSKNATMYYAFPYVKLCLRDKFSLDNAVNILYNVVDKSYSIQNGMQVIQGASWFVNNKRTAYFVTSIGSTVYIDNSWYAYDDGNINFSHKSKRYVLGDGVDYKRISQVEAYGQVTPWLRTTIDIYVDGTVIDSREIYYEEDILPTTWSTEMGNSLLGANNESQINAFRTFVVRYEYFNDWRDFSFWIRWNWQWKFELHGLNLMYKNIKAYDLHY